MSHWQWAAARSIGTSHTKAGGICEDACAVREIAGQAGTLLIAIASDGAGSASYGHLGSAIACRRLTQLVSRYWQAGHAEMPDIELVSFWIDAVRDAIGVAAKRREATPRDFAATLVAVLASDADTLIVHVGDGAAVVAGASAAWSVPSWPAAGEYAATTYFITDDPAPRVDVVRLGEPVSRLAVFTDGIERLVLDFKSREAHAPFFDRMIAPIAASAATGRNRSLSAKLRQYLGSESINSRTDDDKTLVLACRQ